MLLRHQNSEPKNPVQSVTISIQKQKHLWPELNSTIWMEGKKWL